MQEVGYIKNTIVLIFQNIQCLHLINFEVILVLVSSRTQVQPQLIINPDYLPDDLSISYDCGKNDMPMKKQFNV